MNSPLSLFELNPATDLAAAAAQFAIKRRIQIRDVLTTEAAATIHDVFSRLTPWGLAYEAAGGPVDIDYEELRVITADRRTAMNQALAAQMRSGNYAFAYHRYPMINAYLDKRMPGGPHDLLVEHINSEHFVDFIRALTGDNTLIKADAQATLFAPGQFLSVHDDSHVMEGWRYAYVLNFARDWRPEYGGILLFHDERGVVVDGFVPCFNALNIFAVPQRHSVSMVSSFAPIGRFAISGWFRDR